MSTWEVIADRARELPPEKQIELLDFAEFLRDRAQRHEALRSLAGLWQGFDLSPQDIDTARREMWGNFPREAP